jgi:hypothetical protein
LAGWSVRRIVQLMYQDMRDGGEMRAVPLRTIKEMCEELQQLGVEMEWDGEINCPEALKRYGVFSIVKSALITYGALPGMLTPSTVDGRKTYVESALDQMPVGQELPTLSGAQLELLVAAHCLWSSDTTWRSGVGYLGGRFSSCLNLRPSSSTRRYAADPLLRQQHRVFRVLALITRA